MYPLYPRFLGEGLELLSISGIKFATYWRFIPQDKRGKKLLYMVFFSSAIGGVVWGVLMLAFWKFL